MAWLELEFEPQQLAWSGRDHHRIGGNERVRALHDHRIVEDLGWRSAMSLGQQVGVSLLALPARFPGSPLWEIERRLLSRWFDRGQ
jgi:hypothetical protein